jgi:hypothetical protein
MIELLIPMSLQLINDYQIDNKVTAIKILEHMMNQSPMEILHYRTIIFHNLHTGLSFRSDAKLLDMNMSCMIHFLKLLDNNREELLTTMEDFCSILEYCSIISTENDPSMMKSVLQRTSELVNIVGYDIARFLKRLNHLLLEYPYYTSTIELLDECAKLLHVMIESCTPRFQCGEINAHCMRILTIIDQRVELAQQCNNIIPLLKLITTCSPSTMERFEPSNKALFSK